MGNFSVNIAKESDDAKIRNLLNTNPVGGKIQLLYQKNPSYFLASNIASIFSNTIVIKNNAAEAVAVQTTAIRDVYLNQKSQRLAYISNLRVDKKYQGQKVLKEGFDLLKSIHNKFGAPFYYSTIIADNKKAEKVLQKNIKNGLQFKDYGYYYTKLIIIHGKKKEIDNKYRIIRGSKDRLEEIVSFLQKEGSKKNFYPYLKKEDFEDKNFLKDFKLENFYLAMDNDEIVGVLGKWDQNKFKQNVVTKYGGIYKYNKIYNTVCKLWRMPKLPNIGETINFAYVSFIATKNNDVYIFEQLLKNIYNDCLDSELVYLALGFHEKDQLLRSLDGFLCINYKSKLYLSYWDKPDILNDFDIGIPYIELATL